MSYTITKKAYWYMKNELKMTKREIIDYLNTEYRLRGTITQLHITE